MAVPCRACGEPVHEAAPKCPHCGGTTGVAPDRQAVIAAAISKAQSESAKKLAPDEKPFGLRDIAPLPRGAQLDPFGAVIGGVVGYALDKLTSNGPTFVDNPMPEEADLPRAVARIVQHHPIKPLASAEPEKPLPPGDAPRFLK